MFSFVLGKRVNPETQCIVKMVPSSPPMCGEHVLVDGFRCRVTRSRIKWDGQKWTILALRVKEEARASH